MHVNSACSSGIDVWVNIFLSVDYNRFKYKRICLYSLYIWCVYVSESKAFTAGITTQSKPSVLYVKSIRTDNYETLAHNTI